jgi:pyruvate formate lyase activating enzyme
MEGLFFFYFLTSKLSSPECMLIGGFQKLTLIDYPGKVATVVFTIGCNFRCSFCHNPDLIHPSPEMIAIGKENEETFFTFLKKRKGLLDGVCVTGGEPTVHPDLIPFLERIRSMGFLVKLDSNGLRPEVLREVLRRKLADYIAMDIKHAPQKYASAMGVEIDIAKVKESVEIIKKSGLPYEFRTTVVPGIHTEADFDAIGKWIRGTKHYYLQPFRSDIVFDPKVREVAKGKMLDFDDIQKRLKKYGIDAMVRG